MDINYMDKNCFALHFISPVCPCVVTTQRNFSNIRREGFLCELYIWVILWIKNTVTFLRF